MARGGGQGRIAKISGMCWEWITGALPQRFSSSGQPEPCLSSAWHTHATCHSNSNIFCVCYDGKKFGKLWVKDG